MAGKNGYGEVYSAGGGRGSERLASADVDSSQRVRRAANCRSQAKKTQSSTNRDRSANRPWITAAALT